MLFDRTNSLDYAVSLALSIARSEMIGDIMIFVSGSKPMTVVGRGIISEISDLPSCKVHKLHSIDGIAQDVWYRRQGERKIVRIYLKLVYHNF